MGHVHDGESWCDECALAAEISGLAKYDISRNAWYHDSLSTHRLILTDQQRKMDEPIPLGTTWLVSRIMFQIFGPEGYPEIAGWTGLINGRGVKFALYRNTVAPENLVTPLSDWGANSIDHQWCPLEIPGGTYLLWGPEIDWDSIGDPGEYDGWSAQVHIEYRIRTVAEAPVATRRRIFEVPVISPDSGSPTAESEPIGGEKGPEPSTYGIRDTLTLGEEGDVQAPVRF